jgi:hypothetical protein
MVEMSLSPCTFGHASIVGDSGSTGTYIALREPSVTEGCTLLTYPTEPGSNRPVDLPSVGINSPHVTVDCAGHVLFNQ